MISDDILSPETIVQTMRGHSLGTITKALTKLYKSTRAIDKVIYFAISHFFSKLK